MKCLCFAKDQTRALAARYKKGSDGWIWAIHRECPVHGSRFTTVVWTPRHGWLNKATAGTVAK